VCVCTASIEQRGSKKRDRDVVECLLAGDGPGIR
jgi:hypothetical protein